MFYTISKMIEEQIKKNKKFVICPMGKIGLTAKYILEERFGRNGIYVDNKMCAYNPQIIGVDEYKKNMDSDEYVILLLSTKFDVDRVLKESLCDCKANKISLIDYMYYDYMKEIKKQCAVRKVVGYDLIRIGSQGDGGYVMVNDFENVDVAYSFGIGTSIDWDLDVAKYGIDVFCYDHTIDALPQKHDHLHFEKTGIAAEDRPEELLLSIQTIVNNNCHNERENMILKMDVEGAEREFLENITTDMLNRFSQITLELHGIVGRSKLWSELLRKINITHQSVWVHANNYSTIFKSGDLVIPDLLEITFVNRAKYKFEDISYTCPCDYDFPNIKDKDEIWLNGWGTMDLKD